MVCIFLKIHICCVVHTISGHKMTGAKNKVLLYLDKYFSRIPGEVCWQPFISARAQLKHASPFNTSSQPLRQNADHREGRESRQYSQKQRDLWDLEIQREVTTWL